MKDVIDKIRSAEKSAEEIKAQAEKEADLILSQVKAEGRKYIEEAVAAANIKAEEIITMAEKESKYSAEAAIAAAEKEADESVIIAQSRMDSAVLKILEGVVSDI